MFFIFFITFFQKKHKNICSYEKKILSLQTFSENNEINKQLINIFINHLNHFFMKKFTFLFAAMMACATMFAENPVITCDSLWNEFKPYFNEYYSLGRYDQTIENVMTFWNSGVDADAKILTSEDSRYKWLGDFIQEVSTGSGIVIETEAQWRASLWAFLNGTQRTDWLATANFEGVNDPAVWNELYYANMPATPSAVENTTVAVKAQKIIRNGQVLMVRDGKTFNMMGVEVK